MEHLLELGELDSEHLGDALLGMESFSSITLAEIERAHAAAQRALLQRDVQLFAVAVEFSSDAILTASLDGTITAQNPAAEQLLGYAGVEALGCRVAQLAPESERAAVVEMLASAAAGVPMRGVETQWQDKWGRTRDVSLTVSPVRDGAQGVVGLSIIARDVTEQKRAELSLRQAQKMEAVGRLAGGIAHDFNNLLTVILAHASFMLDDAEDDQPERESMSEILQAGESARALTQQLLSFSRGQPIEPAAVDVYEAVLATHRLLRRTLREDIEIVVLPREDLWPVWMDRGQLEQLLMNLALNARDAMPKGGKLSIEMENETLHEADGVLPSGDYVRLRVSDTGVGMPRDVLAHLFEPFFTTKPMGRGTGLGLATCYAIARRAGGDVRAASTPGVGSTFTILLPRAEQAIDAACAPVASDPATLRGAETILVVEDDPAVLGAATLVLRRQGYGVLQAQDGEAALRLVEAERGRIALVLTDVVMPRMSGPELVERLAKSHPELRVLFMTGYADERAMRHHVLANAPVLSKPFLPLDLARRVREVLDAPPGVRPSVRPAIPS
jgi:PAS domain S-box-containing protein